MELLQREKAGRPPELISEGGDDYVAHGDRRTLITYQRNVCARRFRLYLRNDGAPRVTIPRSGSKKEARAFVVRHLEWLAARLDHFQTEVLLKSWIVGSEILLRGESVRIELFEQERQWAVRAGELHVPVSGPDIQLREVLQGHLQAMAALELPPRVGSLAAAHGIVPGRVVIRNQRSRWGSASKKGTICLNWRLVQMPDAVRDYIILHELMHLREMNHSARFWALMDAVCPGHPDCRRWLLRNNTRLQ